jgi:hypothetical protein
VAPALSKWLLEGFNFLEVEATAQAEVREAVRKTLELWHS